ncbi:MAG: hypothetical protein AAGH78_14455, partial [Cyanobacteria bacterium P01_H01_bin.58]
MTDPDLLAQAKQGDPTAIAALINRSLSSRGVWARVEGDRQSLSLVLESTQAPEPEKLVPFIRQGLHRLQPQGIDRIILCGCALGEVTPAWQKEIVLQPDHQEQPFPSLNNSLPTQQKLDIPTIQHQTAAESLRGQPRVSMATARSPQRSTVPRPFVLKWSDFEPMLLAIIGFVAIYGF